MKLLNLGCGERRHPDWINMDVRDLGPEVRTFDVLGPLPFGDGELDAVYHSHMLEHLPRRYAPLFVAECFRVLKPGGTLRVAVPDFERLARLYLENLDLARAGDMAAADRYQWLTIEMFDQMVRPRSGGDMVRYWRQNPMPCEDFVIERCGSEVTNALKELRRPDAVPPREGINGFDRAAEPGPEETGTFRHGGEPHLWMYDEYSLGLLLTRAGFAEVAARPANASRIPDFNRYLLDIEPDGRTRKPDSLFMEGVRPA